MLPAAAVVAIWLCAARYWRSVLWWRGLVAGVLALTVATKIGFIGWGLGIRLLPSSRMKIRGVIDALEMLKKAPPTRSIRNVGTTPAITFNY
jgi:hypothetical protein